MGKNKKILILYTSVGLGHKSIAENIGFYLGEEGYKVRVADIGKVQSGKFEKIVVAVHQFINRRLPFVWGWLYDWGHYIILPFRVFIAGFNYKLTKSFVDEFQPDLIISTQTSASAVISYLKQKGFYKKKFAIAFSDYHLHPYYLYDQADFYLVNIEGQKQEMIIGGVPPEKIFVCGIILKPKIDVNIGITRNKLGIGSGEKVVLISSGSLGSGIDSSLIEKFINQPNIRPLVVCGKNEEVYKKLHKQYQTHPLCLGCTRHLPQGGRAGTPQCLNPIILSYYSPMDELYAIADIFITKPGGLSVAEALRWKLPILISHLLPGQEVYNLRYLESHKLVMPKANDIFAAALEELSSAKFRSGLLDDPALNSLFNGWQTLLGAVSNAIGEGSKIG